MTKFHWRKGAPLNWSKKPWSEDDKVAVVFATAFISILLLATFMAPYA